MKITVKKLADLRKPAHNIRRHSDKQITEYIRSIEMFGQIKPLVVECRPLEDAGFHHRRG